MLNRPSLAEGLIAKTFSFLHRFFIHRIHRCRLERRNRRLAEKRMKKLLLSNPTPDFESTLTTPEGNYERSSEFQSNRAEKNSNSGE